MNEKGRRNFKLMVMFVFIGGLIVGSMTHFIMSIKIKEQQQQIETLKENQAKKEGIIFENEKVAIKYYDVVNKETNYDGYDIIIETKNGTNITSEFDLKSGQNDSIAYLVGRNFETAFDFWYDNLRNKNIEWNWEANYPIEKD